eukprot:6647792-Alexandrium_andersonii.AAC.1
MAAQLSWVCSVSARSAPALYGGAASLVAEVPLSVPSGLGPRFAQERPGQRPGPDLVWPGAAQDAESRTRKMASS